MHITPEEIAAAAARSGIVELASDAAAQLCAALNASGGGLTLEEHAQLGAGEQICRVEPGKVWVNPKLAKVRRKQRPRPPARRAKALAVTARPFALARARAPRRRRTASVRAAESRAGPGDPDPEPPRPLAAAPEIQNAERGPGRHGRGAPMGRLMRFPLRRIAAVLVCRDGDEWFALAGSHGWSFASRAEARAEAHWLSRNLGLPVRELIRRAPC